MFIIMKKSVDDQGDQEAKEGSTAAEEKPHKTHG